MKNMSFGSFFSSMVVLLAWAFFMFLSSLGEEPRYGTMLFVTLFAILFLAGMKISRYPKGFYDPKLLVYCEITIACVLMILFALFVIMISHVFNGKLNEASGIAILLVAAFSKLFAAYVHINEWRLWYVQQRKWWQR